MRNNLMRLESYRFPQTQIRPVNMKTPMNNLTARAYFKSMLFPSVFLTFFAIVTNIEKGCKVEDQPILTQLITIMVSLMILQHCDILFTFEECKQSFKLSIVTGFSSGIILTLVARTGLAFSFLLLSSDRNMATLIHIFIGSWQLYLWMALLGIVGMLIDPFFRVVLHKDIFRHRKPSSFYMKYSPSALIYKYVLRKKPPWQNDTDLDGKDTDLAGKDQ